MRKTICLAGLVISLGFSGHAQTQKSVAVSKTDELGRYEIHMVEAGGFPFIIKLDTKTGKTWRFIKLQVEGEQNDAWMPIFPVSDDYQQQIKRALEQ